MSPRLPNISAREAVHAFGKARFEIITQKGSHIRLVNKEGIQIVIPFHTGDLKRPLLKALIRHVGLTEEEFRKLL